MAQLFPNKSSSYPFPYSPKSQAFYILVLDTWFCVRVPKTTFGLNDALELPSSSYIHGYSLLQRKDIDPNQQSEKTYKQKPGET